METMNKELTEEEMVFYSNYALIDMCDCCGNYFPITNRHNGEKFLTIKDNGIYCQKCSE